jgi:indole-3-glycerol phosphate synthase
VEQKRREVATLPREPITVESLRAAMTRRGGRRDFLAALRAPRLGRLALIGEIKKASPSAGLIRADFDPLRLARDYAAAGATCLSVLTDEKFFQGSRRYLREIRRAVDLPLLRKDFIIDARQILESVEWGADAVLLIAAVLDDAALRRFHALATGAGLAALVEVHDELELDRALAAGARLIGVNNRDLRTFQVNLATTERLADAMRARTAPDDCLLVAESGLRTHAEVERLRQAGAQAVLVGESLMRQGDLKQAVAELLGVPPKRP